MFTSEPLDFFTLTDGTLIVVQVNGTSNIAVLTQETEATFTELTGFRRLDLVF